jgi:hypothetical protein
MSSTSPTSTPGTRPTLDQSHPFPWGQAGTAHRWISVFVEHDREALLEVLGGMSQAALDRSHPFPWGPEGTAHRWVSVFVQHDRGHARDLRG